MKSGAAFAYRHTRGWFSRGFLPGPQQRCSSTMLPFMYRCPSTDCRVQGFSAEEVSKENADDYLTVLCTECQQIHLVNPATGEILGVEVLGEEDELESSEFRIETADSLNSRRSIH
jgi:hypothetical protein